MPNRERSLPPRGPVPLLSAIKRRILHWIAALRSLLSRRKSSETSAAADRDVFCFRENAVDAGTAEDRFLRNAMVGTVRTREQLRYCLKENLYYAPSRLLPADPGGIRFIALHEEDIGTDAVIRHWGAVRSCSVRKRGTIPTPMRPNADRNEEYHIFAVEAWQSLSPPIRICDSHRGVPRFTSRYLLEHCTRSYQLFVIFGEQDLTLMRQLDRISAAEREEASAGDLSAFLVGTNHYLIPDSELYRLQTKDGTTLSTIPADLFRKHPRAAFTLIRHRIRAEDGTEPHDPLLPFGEAPL